MKWLLRFIPFEEILRWVAKQLTQVNDEAIDLVIEKVKEYDRKNLPGFKKREKVYEELKKHLDGVADWAIYFLIELWVAWLRAWAARN